MPLPKNVPPLLFVPPLLILASQLFFVSSM